MKKILMIVAAVLTFATAFSQENPEKKTFSIGPSIGFGHTGIRNTVGTDIFKPSWSAGVIFNYSSLKHVGFSADVLWSMEGARVESEGSEADLTLQYIRVPLKFAYYFGEFEDNFRPKVTVGPSMGFLISGVSDSDVEGGSNVNVKSFYNTFDIGLNASIGFNLKLATNIWLNTDFNYYTGFTAIRNNQYNSNFGVKLGVAFGL
nr:porin family protein [uncultured Fluviicola sp.]